MVKTKVEKFIRDGKVAVLISPGHGAGWSTWADDAQREAALFDHRFVRAALGGVKVIGPVAAEVFGPDAYFYDSGWRDIEIVWLDPGTRFRVDVYDGSESLVDLGACDHWVA